MNGDQINHLKSTDKTLLSKFQSKGFLDQKNWELNKKKILVKETSCVQLKLPNTDTLLPPLPMSLASQEDVDSNHCCQTFSPIGAYYTRQAFIHLCAL